MASGLGEIFIGRWTVNEHGETVTDATFRWRGWAPKWRAFNVLTIKIDGDMIADINIDTEVAKILGGPANTHAAGGGNASASIPPVIWVAVGRNGQYASVVEHGGNNRDRSIYLSDGDNALRVIVDHAIVNFCNVEDGYIVWSRFEPREVWGCRPGGQPEKLMDGLYGLPVMTPSGPWVIVQTNDDLRIFPWGSTDGYIVRTGEDNNYHPDALWIDNEIALVFNTSRGEPRRHNQNINLPRVSLLASQSPQPVPQQPKPEEPKEPVMEMMMLPADVHATFVKCVEKFPHAGSDDDRRAAMKKAVATIRARHGERWVWKTEHAHGVSPSKDALGYVPESEGPIIDGERMKMFMWDMIDGGSRQAADAHKAHEFREAYVIAVPPHDYLAGAVPIPEQPKPDVPSPEQPTCRCDELQEALDSQRRKIERLEERVLDLELKPDFELPKLVAKGRVRASTSREWSHAHVVEFPIILDVEEEK